MHRNWQRTVNDEANWLESLQPDLVLADVPYLTLAAADRAGIPSIALCCLNWADIYRYFFSGHREAVRILGQMEAAYRTAKAFLCPEPSMPMDFLDNQIPVAPIAVQGDCRRDELNERLQLHDGEALVLAAPGGIDMRFAMENWPDARGIHWLVSEHWNISHPDTTSLESTGLGITDLVRSCDAVLGKCGYGTVTECVVNGTPLMYVPRPDWPEQATLLEWLEYHQGAVEVAPHCLISGDFETLVRQAMSRNVKTCLPEGAAQVADYLSGFLC